MSRRRAHERTLARARAKREAERLRAQRRRRTIVTLATAIPLLLVFGGGTALLMSRRSSPTPTVESAATPAPTPTPTVQAGGIACNGKKPPAADTPKPMFKQADLSLRPGVDYRARIVTSCGEIVVNLQPEAGPMGVNSFVFLARKGFYDGLIVHRIEPGFVIQSGDPKGDGTGGAGYTIPEELTIAEARGYPAGTLALANSGAPNSSGSQWFITIGDAASLPPKYSILGRVSKGQEVVQTIGKVPVAPNPNAPQLHQPTQTVYIERIIIEEVPRPGATPTGGAPKSK